MLAMGASGWSRVLDTSQLETGSPACDTTRPCCRTFTKILYHPRSFLISRDLVVLSYVLISLVPLEEIRKQKSRILKDNFVESCGQDKLD